MFHVAYAQRNSHKALLEIRELREEMAKRQQAVSEFASSEILDEVRR